MDYQLTALKLARDCSALLTNDHFALAGGDHSDSYIDKSRLLINPPALRTLCDLLVQSWQQESRAWPEVIIGPAIGGALVAQRVADAFEKSLRRSPILATFSERRSHTDGFVLYRHFDQIVQDKRVLVVDDVLTGGHSVASTAEAVANAGGQVIGAGVLFCRSQVRAEDLGVERLAVLAYMPMQSWSQDACPLCEKNVPINEHFGHGRMFSAINRSSK